MSLSQTPHQRPMPLELPSSLSQCCRLERQPLNSAASRRTPSPPSARAYQSLASAVFGLPSRHVSRRGPALRVARGKDIHVLHSSPPRYATVGEAPSTEWLLCKARLPQLQPSFEQIYGSRRQKHRFELEIRPFVGEANLRRVSTLRRKGEGEGRLASAPRTEEGALRKGLSEEDEEECCLLRQLR